MDALTKLLVTPALPELVEFMLFWHLSVTSLYRWLVCKIAQWYCATPSLVRVFVNCNCHPPPHLTLTPYALHLLEVLLHLLVSCIPLDFSINCLCVYIIAAIDDADSYLHMFQLDQVESLQHYWEKEYMWEGPKTQPHSGQIELLTDWLENFLAARKDATPERLLRSQQRWKQLSTEVAVISQLKRQTRQSQLVRALVSNLVFFQCVM